MKQSVTLLVITLIIIMALVACADTVAPAPDLPAPTPPPESAASLSEPNLPRGQQLYLDKQCVACHGSSAEGGIGPKMADTELVFGSFLQIVRTALPPKPAFSETELTTQDVYNIYSWLQNMEPSQPIAIEAPALAEGEALGMTLWTEGQCDTCHGAFAQGSPDGPALVSLTYPYELERAKMRETASTIPQHAAEHMRDVVLQRLYKWLQAGANPADGC
jgi:mono/diheme cytochrome c family protein